MIASCHQLRFRLRLILAARGATPAAFGRRCIPAGGVAPPSNTAGILSRRAWPTGRLAALGATLAFHHGLLGAALCCLVATAAEALPFLPRCGAASQVRSVACVVAQDPTSAAAALAALRAIADGQTTVGTALQPSSLAANPFLAPNSISRGLSNDISEAGLSHPRFVRSSGSRVTAIVDGADPAALGAGYPPGVVEDVPVAPLDPVTCLLFAAGLFGVGLSIAMYRRGIGADLYFSQVSPDGFREVTRRACVCVTFGRRPVHSTPLRI